MMTRRITQMMSYFVIFPSFPLRPIYFAATIVLCLHNVTSVRLALPPSQLEGAPRCFSSPSSRRPSFFWFTELHAPLPENRAIEALSKCLAPKPSIATSTSFLDSTCVYSVPSLSCKAHQILMDLDPDESLAQHPDASNRP